MDKFRQQKQESTVENVASATGNAANAALASGDPKAAVQKYRDALKLNSSDAKTWFNLSLALHELGDRDGEREALEKALALDASLVLAHNQLGLLDAAANRQSEAESEFKQAISLDPQFAEAQSNLGVLYGKLGRKEEAETLLRKAVENNPRLTEAFLNLGLILASEGRLDEADGQLEKAAALSPANPTVLTALGNGAGQARKSQRGHCVSAQSR